MAAAMRLLDTFELLEIILFELPIRDLLMAQRISKQTKAVIDNSYKLQQALFLQPIPGGSVLFNASPTYYDAGSGGYTRLEARLMAEKLATDECLVNPLLEDLISVMAIVDGDSHVPLEPTLSASIKHLVDAYGSPSASWRRMLPTQPPIESSFYIDCFTSKRDMGRCVEKCYPRGLIRTSEIIEKLDRRIEENEDSTGFVVVLRRAAPLIFGKKLESNQQLEDMMNKMRHESKEQTETHISGEKCIELEDGTTD